MDTMLLIALSIVSKVVLIISMLQILQENARLVVLHHLDNMLIVLIIFAWINALMVNLVKIHL